MRTRPVAAIALLALAVAGCARLREPRPTLLPPGSPGNVTTTSSRLPAPHYAASDLSIADLPPGWSIVGERPPTEVGPVMLHLATCLGTKLAAVASGTLSGPTAAFRSPDGKEWLTASIGPVPASWPFPPPLDNAFAGCAKASVAYDLAAHGSRSVQVVAVGDAPLASSVVPRSLDLRVTARFLTAFGVPGTTFVDLVWLAANREGAVIDLVDQAFTGDLSSADEGLVAQATDAVARHLAGL